MAWIFFGLHLFLWQDSTLSFIHRHLGHGKEFWTSVLTLRAPSEINAWSVASCHLPSSPFLLVEHTLQLQHGSDSPSISATQGGHAAGLGMPSATLIGNKCLKYPLFSWWSITELWGMQFSKNPLKPTEIIIIYNLARTRVPHRQLLCQVVLLCLWDPKPASLKRECF